MVNCRCRVERLMLERTLLVDDEKVTGGEVAEYPARGA
jgi:hypothetical protein